MKSISWLWILVFSVFLYIAGVATWFCPWFLKPVGVAFVLMCAIPIYEEVSELLNKKY